MSKWDELIVEDLVAPTRNALVGGPFGSNLVSRDYVDNGVPVIRGKNMGLGRWVTGEFAYVNDEKAEALSANIARPGDLIFTQRGTVGQVAIIPDSEYRRYVVSQSQMKLTPHTNKADVMFLYYVFSSPEMYHYMIQNSIQTGVPHTNLTILRNTPVNLPPIEEQRAIAHVLASLDDKIEANRRMNETLEATARAIFKSWFVDFDPVYAKANGEVPYGMDADTAALFPDSFQESDLGLIPSGWRIGKLKDAIEIHDKIRIPLSRRQREKRQGEYRYYGATSVMDYIDDYLFDGIYILMAEDGSVRDDNDNPILQYVWGKFWVNNHAHVLTGKNSISSENLFLALQNIRVTPYVTGAVQLKISQTNMKRMPFTFAERKVHIRFTEIIEPLFAKIRHNHDENTTLVELRDALLPRLISGELCVGDVHDFMEDV